MPVYEITAPDGRVFEVTAPEGASEQDVIAYAQANYSSASNGYQPKKRAAADLQQAAAEHRRKNPAGTGMGFWGNAVAGAGKSFVDTGEGLSQLYTGLTGTPEEIAAKQAEVDDRRRTDQALMNTGGGIAGNIVGSVAQIAAPIPGGGSAKVASYLGKAAPYVGAAARGGVYSGAQPVGTGETRLSNAAQGAAWGAGGQALASGVGAMAKAAKGRLQPVVQRAIQDARAAGIPLHASQVSESRFAKTVGSVLNQFPLSGAARAARKQQESFNQAVGRTFGADAPVLTDDVMAAAKGRLNQGYERIFSGKTVALDRQAVTELVKLGRRLESELEAGPREVVRKQLDRVFDNIDANGGMPAKVYQSLRSEWGSKFPKGTDKGRVLAEARKLLDDAAGRSLGPRESAALKKLNSMWANMRTAEDALKQVSGAAGNVKPASLYPLIRKGSTEEMRRLAQMGQTVLKDPIPDSGTVGRGLVAAGLTGAGVTGGASVPLLAKAALAGATMGRAMNSNTLSKLLEQGKPMSGLARLVQPAPRVLPALGNSMAPATPYAAMMGAAMEFPEKGPEFFANLPPDQQQRAIMEFAQQTGQDPAQVAAQVQAASARLAEVRR
jgi:hypothetical protein